MIVLDASALLAFLFKEDGHDRVGPVLRGSAMSAVNLAEVLGRFARDGHSSLQALSLLEAADIDFVPFDVQQAALVADLLPRTRHRGLSIADRACLALASTLGAPVMTADRAWSDLDLGVEVQLIR